MNTGTPAPELLQHTCEEIVLNELDRFRLEMEAIDRLPQTGNNAVHLKQQLQDKLAGLKQHIGTYGQDMPEIHEGKWRAST